MNKYAGKELTQKSETYAFQPLTVKKKMEKFFICFLI